MNPTIHLDIAEDQQALGEAVRRAAETTLETESAAGCELTLAIVGLDEMRSLNRRYAGVDHPTDVLSFPDGAINPETERRYIGDIAICLPIAAAQSEAAGHSLTDELMLLAVHGVLHLLGYDHAEEAEKSIMWTRQAEVLLLLEADPGTDLDAP